MSFIHQLCSISACYILLSSFAYSSTLKLAWEINDLANPESVVFDQARNIAFVSLMNSGAEEGNAFIGKISIEGNIVNDTWVGGLTSPKGIAILGNRLFVSDVKDLVEIDIDQAKIVGRYTGERTRFLNDVAITSEGDVFVSDMFNSSIYKLNDFGVLELWLETPELENPNGLLVKDGGLLISAWGAFSNEKPMTAEKGNFKHVSFKDKKVTQLSKDPIGNLDGVQVLDKDQLIISDWISGDIYTLDKDYNPTKVLDLEQSAGDIAYIQDRNLLLVPMAKQGKVLAYILSK